LLTCRASIILALVLQMVPPKWRWFWSWLVLYIYIYYIEYNIYIFYNKNNNYYEIMIWWWTYSDMLIIWTYRMIYHIWHCLIILICINKDSDDLTCVYINIYITIRNDDRNVKWWKIGMSDRANLLPNGYLVGCF
jgi:hypothetical protein